MSPRQRQSERGSERRARRPADPVPAAASSLDRVPPRRREPGLHLALALVTVGTFSAVSGACAVDKAGIDVRAMKRDGATVDLPVLPPPNGGAGGGPGSFGGRGPGGAPGAGGTDSGTPGGADAGAGGNPGTLPGTGGVPPTTPPTGGAGAGGDPDGDKGENDAAAPGGQGGDGIGEAGEGGAAGGTDGEAGAGGAPVSGNGGRVPDGEAGRGGQGSGGQGGTIRGGGGRGGSSMGCTATSCPNGCCVGNTCVTGTTAAQCGREGAACQRCADCQRCATATRTCELDPNSRWQMIAVDATLSPRPDGTSWDRGNDRMGGPLPDPFVELEMPPGTAIGWTATITDELTPSWNSPLQSSGTTLRARDLLSGGQAWLLWVGDEDANGLADVMCDINGPLDTSVFAAGGFTRTNVQSCQALTIKLTCQP